MSVFRTMQALRSTSRVLVSSPSTCSHSQDFNNRDHHQVFSNQTAPGLLSAPPRRFPGSSARHLSPRAQTPARLSAQTALLSQAPPPGGTGGLLLTHPHPFPLFSEEGRPRCRAGREAAWGREMLTSAPAEGMQAFPYLFFFTQKPE